ncbi:hypothetical protein E3E31_01590 [Thermococcus sp. M39]|uniref:ABC transporter permease n=1 Tax=unclassified Thermococcus TaxID=2627626 RepID=UPI00143A4AB6|nr:MULTISPECIES: ABC transporter permease [unclassified Thermococcus]NJE07247.1 hypothetical protein [Thermococcus sp. M39]NJE12621.1 hypothetical protein [Thermococcus sp. LS2]
MRRLIYRNLRTTYDLRPHLFFSLLLPTLIYIFIISLAYNKIVKPIPMYDRYLSYSAFFVPAAILINTLQLSILCGSMLWTDKYNGMLEQILSFSSRAEYFLSRVLSIVIISSSTAITLGLLSTTIIKDEVSLSYATPFLFLYAVVMSSIIFASLSFCVSAVVKTPDKLTMFNRMITTPIIAISGIFYPPEYLPPLISEIAKFNPLTYAANLIRASLLGIQVNTAFQIATLTLFSGAMLIIAYILFRKMDVAY